MTTVHSNFFKLGDKFATVLGDDVQVGQKAPEFISAALDWRPVNPVAQFKGKVAILSAVPSLDTDVCDRETRRFNEEAAKLSDDIIIWTISTDFPYAQKRWCVRPGSLRCASFQMCLKLNWALIWLACQRTSLPAPRGLCRRSRRHIDVCCSNEPQWS